MHTEIEVKFLHVDHEAVRSKLQKLGAICTQPMRLMKRAIFEDTAGTMHGKGGYIRVRDEGDKVTITYKQFDALSIDGAKEIETEVGSFNAMVDILRAANLEQKSLQESKRETWNIENVEVVLDEWPWIDPYIEIEAGTEAAVRRVSEKLGFSWNAAVFGDVMVAYRAQYPWLKENDTVGNVKNVRFHDSLPDSFKQ